MTERKDSKDALTIAYKPVKDLIPYKGNPRTHSEKQIKQIAKSIEKFGFTNPLLVDKQYNIIAGHGRLLAANTIGLKEVPTIQLENMSEAQKRAYIIADNKLAENAGWDKDLLKMEFSYLSELDFDISLTGFELAEIDTLLNFDQIDDEPEVIIPKNAVSQPGDIWLLGKHRIICGNALDKTVLDQLMNGRKAQIIFTDPPYNVPISGHVSVAKRDDF